MAVFAIVAIVSMVADVPLQKITPVDYFRLDGFTALYIKQPLATPVATNLDATVDETETRAAAVSASDKMNKNAD